MNRQKLFGVKEIVKSIQARYTFWPEFSFDWPYPWSYPWKSQANLKISMPYPYCNRAIHMPLLVFSKCIQCNFLSKETCVRRIFSQIFFHTAQVMTWKYRNAELTYPWFLSFSRGSDCQEVMTFFVSFMQQRLLNQLEEAHIQKKLWAVFCVYKINDTEQDGSLLVDTR